MVESSVGDCSKEMALVMLEGAQEVLGAERLNSMLDEILPNRSGSGDAAALDWLSFSEVCSLPQILEGVYGIQGGRGLTLRIGRSSFKYGLKQLTGFAGLREVNFRLLPAPMRLERGLKLLADQFAAEFGDSMMVTDEGRFWQLRSETCPFCQDHLAADSCCYWMVGLLQEFTAWASGGRFYPVNEVECRAAGAFTCTYQIEKKPLD